MIAPSFKIAASLFVLTALPASWILDQSSIEAPQSEEVILKTPSKYSTHRPREKWGKFWKLWVHCLFCSKNPCTYRIGRRPPPRNPSPPPSEAPVPFISRR